MLKHWTALERKKCNTKSEFLKYAGAILFTTCKIDLDCKNSYLSIRKDFQAEEVIGPRAARLTTRK